MKRIVEQLSLLLPCLLLTFGHLSEACAQIKATYVTASTAALNNPHDLKLSPDGKFLFVSDVDNNRVAILDPDTLALVGEFGADHQAGTHDVDIDADGKLYVADTHNNRVTIYRLTGFEAGKVGAAKLIGELSDNIRGPEGVLAHPNRRIYVAGAWSHNVVAYQDGNVLAELTGLSSPHDLELASDGNIWLADAGNDRMLLLSPELKILRELKGEPYNFNGVRYQDVLADGMLVVADKYSHQIKLISASGDLALVLGIGKPGKGPGRFKTPEGVESRGNTLWLSDSGNDRVVKYLISKP